MTKNNNPYYINENKKPVEIVHELENKESITLEKKVQIINNFEERRSLIINKSKLSHAARSKIVKKYGTDYLSERAFNHDIALTQMYGPGWGEWIAKTTITIGAGFVLGPGAALVAGGLAAGGAKIAEKVVDDPDAKKVFKFVGDCGGSIAVGGVIGAAANGVGALAGAGEVAGLGSGAGSAAARSAAKEFVVVDGIKILASNVSKARMIASAAHGIKVASDIEKWVSFLKDLGFAGNEVREHIEHVRKGYDYKTWCKVCNA